MNYKKTPIEDLIIFHIGGGWGKDVEFQDSSLVNVVRGTDFSRIIEGDISEVPLRFEKKDSVIKRECRPNDVLLEISGGSAAKGQYVGRVFFITEDILKRFNHPVIPASFCRLLRFDEDLIDPRYAYFYLRNMYINETISIYEVQSTGISNFQFGDFITHESMPLPPLEVQKRIVQKISNSEDSFLGLYQEASIYRSLTNLLITKYFGD